MSNEYLDELERELNNQGIVSNTQVLSPDDKDMKVILDMSRILGVQYSDEQKAILQHRGNSVILACAGSGKALLNGTKVLTSTGYMNIEDLKCGMVVYDEKGNEQVVLGVFPQGKKKAYTMTFEDGVNIACCAEHLWSAYNKSAKYPAWCVYDTSRIIKHLEDGEEFYIPVPTFEYIKRFSGIIPAIERELPQKEVVYKLLQSVGLTEGNVEDYESTIDIVIKAIRKIRDTLDKGYEKTFVIRDAKDKLVWFMSNIFNLMGVVPYIDYEAQKIEFKEESFSGLRKIKSITQFNDYEMTCIKVSGLTQLFVAEHGVVTHNTTISTHLIAKRIQTREIPDVSKLIYTTYSKAGANEMQDRLQKILDKLSLRCNVQVRTLHSFFLSLIKTFGINYGIVTEGQRRKMIFDACKEAGFSTLDDNVALVSNLLSYQVNNLLNDKKTLKCMYNSLEDLTLEQYSKIRMLYASKKQQAKLIDYDDMQAYLYCWLCTWPNSSNPSEVRMAHDIREYCQFSYNDFYIDEAQDVSKLQFEIIKAMIVDPNDSTKLKARLTFIGDDDQCIYEWRGSDPSVIQCIGSDFNIKTSVLSTNYRCKNEIVDFATRGVKCNSRRYEKGMSAHVEGGSVQVLPVIGSEQSLYNMSVKACKHIKAWIQNGYKPSDIAVLSRNNRHLTILNSMLLMNGIYCNCTEDMKVTKGSLYNDIKMLIDMCDTTFKKDIPSKMLWRFNRYIPNVVGRAISTFMDTTAMTLQQVFAYITRTYVDDSIQVGKLPSVNMVADSQLSYHMRNLNDGQKETFKTIYLAMTSTKQEDRFKALSSLYLEGGRDSALKTPDKYREARGFIKLLTALCDEKSFKDMQEFIRILEQFEKGTMGVMGEKVTLSTVHSAKGREWQNVIMFACDNISEPNFMSVANMSEDETITVHELFGYIDEERRLFYVGNTRAKQNLVLMTSEKPSVFLLEALGADIGNAKIVEYSKDENWFRQYGQFISEKYMNDDSKYVYKPLE